MAGMNRTKALGVGGFGSAASRCPGRRALVEEEDGRVKWRVNERVARRWPSTGARTRDVETLAEHARHAVISS